MTLVCARVLFCLVGPSGADTGVSGAAREWEVSAEGGDTGTIGGGDLSVIGRAVGAASGDIIGAGDGLSRVCTACGEGDDFALGGGAVGMSTFDSGSGFNDASSPPTSALVEPTSVAVSVEGGVRNAHIVAQTDASKSKAAGTGCTTPPASCALSIKA